MSKKNKDQGVRVEGPEDAKRREYYSTKIWSAFKLFVNNPA